MFTLLVFIVTLGLLVFVHELGHFIAAKKSGCDVEEFGFGFPPRLFGIKRGGTLYSINWLPLGGFVKIKGEDGAGKADPKSFAGKPAWKRAIILIAGVAMNILLAALLLSIAYMAGTPQALDDVSKRAIVTNRQVGVADVLVDSPAAKAGIEPGDRIGAVNGKKVTTSEELRAITTTATGKLSLTVRHEKTDRTIEVTPAELPETHTKGIGVQLADVGTVRFPWYLAIPYGFAAAFTYLWYIIVSFATLIAGIFRGAGVPSDISGPVGIAVLTGQATRLGFLYLIQFAALLSLNLAVLNAIPFPALDGGRLLFVFIEKLRRKPVSQRAEAIAHQVGFALLMLLVVAVTYRDLVRYGGAITGFVKSIF